MYASKGCHFDTFKMCPFRREETSKGCTFVTFDVFPVRRRKTSIGCHFHTLDVSSTMTRNVRHQMTKSAMNESKDDVMQKNKCSLLGAQVHACRQIGARTLDYMERISHRTDPIHNLKLSSWQTSFRSAPFTLFFSGLHAPASLLLLFQP